MLFPKLFRSCRGLWSRYYSNSMQIRPYERRDIDAIMTMIKQENWNISINELDVAYNTDPAGGFVSTDVSGKVIGASAGYILDDETAIGVAYIVHKDHRGKGIGMPLFRLLANHVSSRNLLGTAAPEMAPKYAANGFLTYGETLFRFSGNMSNFKSDFNDNSVKVIPYCPLLFDKVIQYESTICTPIRPDLLKYWLQQPSSLALVSLINDTVCGYGVIYEATNTTRVAPLFADNLSIAKSILKKLASEFSMVQERGFTIDLSEKNNNGIQMAKDMNLETIRIFPFMHRTVNNLRYHSKIFCRTFWQNT